MSQQEQVSARGERAALGGYMPQFSEFARFVYRELVNNRLEWLRLADPEAGKLDDILYATLTEVHAYQVKWSIAEDILSFAGFKELLPGLLHSWQRIKQQYSPGGKRVVGHLLTSKPFSVRDRLLDGETVLGSFTDFHQQVWRAVQQGQPVPARWAPIVTELVTLCQGEVPTLNEAQLLEFIRHFELHPAYAPEPFSVTQSEASREDAELSTLRSFLMEQVGSRERRVPFTAEELLRALNWGRKFQPAFNHELVVDTRKYQPISRTLAELDAKLRECSGGYLFLEGSPGSGKSTLLTQWVKERSERVIRYYAFDFLDPSSALNTAGRGDAASLYFDLVVQLRRHGFYPETISPYRGDLVFLLHVFKQQLAALAEDYTQTNRATILLIDGLDHVPREYQEAAQSFLRELPAPDKLPAGVYIVLGSQTYELSDLRPAVRDLWRTRQRTVAIAPLSWPEGQAYITACPLVPVPTPAQQQELFDKSQGHPLYLAYLCGRVEQGESIEHVLVTAVQINGNIVKYYEALWQPIASDPQLVELLGLVARINGTVSPAFMREWNFPQQVGRSFRDKAKLLFSELPDSLSFFHNSFRQFLLHQTAFDFFTNTFDEEADKSFHRRLAGYYEQSATEPTWKANYHLYRAGEMNQFVAATTPEQLGQQLEAFRPAVAIEQDAELGIRLARQTRDVALLCRYMFALSEVQQRDENLPLFTNELLTLGEAGLAREALRDGKTLRVTKEAALRAAQTFRRHDDFVEAAILFELGEPDALRADGIVVNSTERFEQEKGVLVAWANIARHYLPLPAIMARLENITLSEPEHHWAPHESPARLRLSMLNALARSARKEQNWEDFEVVYARYNQQEPDGAAFATSALTRAIHTCLKHRDLVKADEYLGWLLQRVDRDTSDDETRINLAEWIYQVRRDLPQVRYWLEGVAQPVRAQRDWDAFGTSLGWFQPLISYNLLLHRLGTPVAVTDAVPTAGAGPRDLPLLEFQRMLCRIVQLAIEAQTGALSLTRLSYRLIPIVRFYYREHNIGDGFSYRATLVKGAYYELLVEAIVLAGPAALSVLRTLLLAEYAEHPAYWEPKVRREILLDFYKYDNEAGPLVEELRQLEPGMLAGLDMSQRVSESLAQARAWLRLGEPAAAKHWLQQGIRESFSVGYRKDYQFSEWLSWLSRINAVQPQHAQERIIWFLGRLHHLKDITEGRAYWRAAELLLGITLDWNLPAGLRQLRWQLDHGHITFESGLETFITSSLKQVRAASAYVRIVALYTNLFLTLATEPAVELLQNLLRTGLAVLGNGFYPQQLPQLIAAIERRALQNTRAELLTALEEYVASQGHQVTDYVLGFTIPEGKVEEKSKGNTLTLKDDRDLNEVEVISRAASYEDLTALLAQERPGSYFNWDKVVPQLTFSLSAEQVQQLAEHPTSRRESLFLASLSEIALRIGEPVLARQLAERSIVLAGSGGWTRFYDGGSRLAAFAALRAVAPAEANDRAFVTFEHDVLDRDWLRSYITSLDEFLPALTDDMPLERVWEEIFNYVKRLLLTSTPAPDLPDLAPQQQSGEEVLAELLGYLAQFPLGIVQQPARGLLADGIREGDAASLAYLTMLPMQEVEAGEVFLEVIMRLPAEIRATLTQQDLRAQVEQLAGQPDYWLRLQARQALKEAKLQLPTLPSRPQPAINALTLTATPPPPARAAQLVLPRAGDPEQQIRPYGRWLALLARASGLNRSVLAHRAAALMSVIAEPTTWTDSASAARKQWLSDVQLRYRYYNPKVEVARRALMRLAAELVDEAEVEEEAIEQVFTMRDYAPYSFTEIAKPALVQTPSGHEYTPGPDGWLGTLQQHPRLPEQLPVYVPGWFVIGESSLQRRLTWERGTERYQMQLTVDPADPDHFFGIVDHELTADYPYLSPEGRHFIVQRNHWYTQFDFRSTWLAFNPLVARHLSWEMDSQRLFAWQHKGQLMVESICWTDGTLEMPSYQADSNAGEGWLVVASPEALRQLVALNKPFFVEKEVMRTKSHDEEEEDSEMIIRQRHPFTGL